MEAIIARLYAVMDKSPLRALSFIMALALAGCIFWDPTRFAAKTSELEIWHGFLLMWAVCAGVIHGVGFRPQKALWQGIFCPLLAQLVLLAGLLFFFF
ncbi:cyd operon protein YbgE [Cedecea colo]|uniref:Cyd operon protein YbgE n=1 Tax=Cedecea colo TaxID=2552946 RepID=A0ABX0VKY5_9ENTR|nr:cyd operon protein YbgE [Cedecea colo]NIY47354.1 cyd operon protein YbgE [Cedecea colo]